MELRFPRELTAAWLEEQVPRLPGTAPTQLQLTDESLRVLLGSWRHTRLFADARLLGVLYAGYERGLALHVDTGRDLPAPPRPDAPRPDDRWRLLRDQVGALAIAAFAESFVDRHGVSQLEQVTATQYEALRFNVGLMRGPGAVAVPAIDRAAAPTPAEIFQAKQQSTLLDRRDDVLRLVEHITFARVGGDERGLMALPRLRPDHKGQLVSFIHEAVENTRDHAMETLTDSLVGGLRFLLVRRLSGERAAVERLIEQTGSASVGRYLDSYLTRALRPFPLVEVTVADCGPGIPARMQGSSEIYAGDLELEQRELERAIEDGGTSKPGGVAGAGLGLGNIVRATGQMRGFISIRTGRLEATHDALSENDAGPWRVEERPYVAGTAISLLWPWRRLEPGAS